MYEKVFGFSAPPFQLSPDARFFFASRGHKRAVAHLTFGLDQGEGFVVITGEVGAGKTTLIEHLWSSLDHRAFAVARIATTQLSGDDLFRLAMAGFGVETGHERAQGLDKGALLLRFADALRTHRAAGRRCVLIVDEAQNLSRPALEELRMLSNIADDGHAAVQTILLGQPEFRTMLASSELDQLRQRVIASFHLASLGPDETRAYIEHRLTTAGWSGRPAIQAGAFDAVHRITDGIPRRINRLFSRVLLLAALDETETVTMAMVEDTAGELAADLDGPVRRAVPLQGDFVVRGDPVERGDLVARVEALERTVARRDGVFRRLIDLLETQR